MATAVSVPEEAASLLESTRGTCPLCDAPNPTFHLAKFGCRMSRCSACGVVFADPVPDLSVVESRYSILWFEREYLPSYGIDPIKPSLDHLKGRFDSELVPLERFRQCGRLLDVGAGAGLLLSQAKRRGWEVHGVELSSFGPLFARTHFGLDIIEGRLEEAAYEDSMFDVVVLQDTIEHVPDPRSLLVEIRRILRTGGALVISTPNYDGMGRRVFGTSWGMISPYEHLALFTVESLTSALKKTGFVVDSISTTNEINPLCTHEPNSIRTRFAALFHKYVPARLIARIKVGDELHCIAVKD